MNLTLECKNCGREFTYEWRRGMKRAYCTPDCRRAGYAKSHYRGELVRRGLSTQEVEERMSEYEYERRPSIIQNKERAKVTQRYSNERRCDYELIGSPGKASVRCVTLLSSYNPGPYCFLHSQMIQDRALEEVKRGLARAERQQMREAG